MVTILMWFLLFSTVQILEMNPEDEGEEDGANIDLDSRRQGKCVVLKTTTRQVRSSFPYIHLVPGFYVM
jgi:26S proteasome regulatory subunit T5